MADSQTTWLPLTGGVPGASDSDSDGRPAKRRASRPLAGDTFANPYHTADPITTAAPGTFLLATADIDACGPRGNKIFTVRAGHAAVVLLNLPDALHLFGNRGRFMIAKNVAVAHLTPAPEDARVDYGVIDRLLGPHWHRNTPGSAERRADELADHWSFEALLLQQQFPGDLLLAQHLLETTATAARYPKIPGEGLADGMGEGEGQRLADGKEERAEAARGD